jgi:hypothetical protein
MSKTCGESGNSAGCVFVDALSAAIVPLPNESVPGLFSSLTLDFLPIHVSLAAVIVVALLVGWDTRRSARKGEGLQRQP